MAILLICSVFIARLFYLQVIKYDFYQDLAQVSQLRHYEIPAERGAIYAYDGTERVPIVLNEIRYSIVADPEIIKPEDRENIALKVADIVNGDKDAIIEAFSKESRYEILAKKQTKEVKNRLEEQYEEGELYGVFAEKTIQRVYPQGAIAGQLLGFVNDDGAGTYGIEESLESQLAGQPGRVRALTDQNGIPLLASDENVLVDPVDGTDVTLTIDVAMQRQIEQLLVDGLAAAKSDSGSVIVLDATTGQVKAMANYPTYDPADFGSVEDPSLYLNSSVSSPLEPGSIMKTLTAAAALDQGVVQADGSYYDPGFFNIDDATIRNVAEVAGSGNRTIEDILRLSLNTGTTYLLQQMGGGEINQQARESWYEYMTERYQLGSPTGIEQGFEESGLIPDPNDGFGLNIRYANTAFGQGMTLTPLQMAAAVASVVNGGIYYQPTLVDGTTDAVGNYIQKQPTVIESSVVSKSTSATLRTFMQTVVESNLRDAAREGYLVGGKTGTAEIANPAGGYYEDRFNGTYVGYVGGDMPQYIVMVRVNEPKIAGYAGSRAAGPVFSSIINILIDNFAATPVTNR